MTKFEQSLKNARAAFSTVRSYSPPPVVVRHEGARVYREKLAVNSKTAFQPPPADRSPKK